MRRPEFIARQSGRPTGLVGSLITRLMAHETAAANAAAIELLRLATTDRVLELGYGHGRTVFRLAERVPGGFVAGVDHAEDVRHAAARRCGTLIARGRVGLYCADSANLPFPAASFDKALAVHTLYFWQPPEPHLVAIRRVLVAGGRLVLAYRPAGAPGAADFPASVYAFRAPAAVHALLAGAGFERIETIQHSADLALTAAHRSAKEELP